MPSLMSNFDVVKNLLQERARIASETRKFFSPDLDAKIAEYSRLEKELETLSSEIAKLVGRAEEEVASPEGSKVKGRRKGGRRLDASEVESKVLDHLKKLETGVGAAGQTIAHKLHGDHWSDVPPSTVYSKVMKFLKHEQAKGTPRVKKEGELINSRWFTC
jgi:hypothetical protein